MANHSSFIPILLLSATAFLVPLLFSRLQKYRIPCVVGEIVVGMVLGRPGFNLIPESDAINFLQFLGFLFLIFLSGMEIDITGISTSLRGITRRNFMRKPIVVSNLIFITTFGLALIAGYGIQAMQSDVKPIIIAILLSTSALGLVLPIIKERDEVSTPLGQVAILSAVLADFGILTMFTVALAHFQGRPMSELLVIGVLFIAAILIFFAGKGVTGNNWVQRVIEPLAHSTPQIKVRGAVLLMFAFVVLTELAHFEVLLGAFIAGALVGDFSGDEHSVLRIKLDAIGYGFFIPFFIIMVGVRLDITPLMRPQAILLMSVILVSAVAVKVIPAIIFTRKWLGTRQSTALGFLISNRVSLLVAASELAYQAQLIPDDVNAGLILTAVVTATTCPVIYARLIGEREQHRSRVFVVGAGRIGRALARRLSLHNITTFLVDNQQAQFKKVVDSSKITAITGDGTQKSTYNQYPPDRTDIMVSLTGSDHTNLAVSRLAKEEFECSRVIARDNNPDNSPRFKAMGVIPMKLKDSAAMTLENLIMRPTLINLLTDSVGQREPVELVVHNKELDGMTIREMPNRGDALLIIIRRGSVFLIPHGNEHLRINDHVLMLCTDEERVRIEQIFSDLAVHGSTDA